MDRDYWGNVLTTQFVVADAPEKRRLLLEFEQAIRDSSEPDYEKDFLLARANYLKAQI